MDDRYYRAYMRQCWGARLNTIRNQLIVYHADDCISDQQLIEADSLLLRLIRILRRPIVG